MNFTDRVNDIDKSIIEDSARFSSMASEYAKRITQHLDKAMQEAHLVIKDNKNNVVDIDWLQNTVLNLSSLLYFVSDKVEEINIRSDVASATAKDAYERAYIESSTQKDEKGKSLRTVAENQSIASQKSQEEAMMSTMYDRASKIVRSRIDAGNEMVATLRKIITLRIAQIQVEKDVDRSNR